MYDGPALAFAAPLDYVLEILLTLVSQNENTHVISSA